jgi:hypothetical protein
MKENLFIKILLVVLAMMLINNMLQNCELKKQQEKTLGIQLEHSKQLQKIINEDIGRRRDTVRLADTYIYNKTIEREKVRYEIYKTANIDSLVKLYFRLRPDSAGFGGARGF